MKAEKTLEKDLAKEFENSIEHVTIIRNPIVSSLHSYSAPVTAPLALAYLSASLVDAGIDVTPIDAVGEAIDQVRIFDDPPCRIRGLSFDEIISRISRSTQMIAFSCMFSQEWIIVKRLIEQVAAEFPKVPIILGGEHATAIPEEILRTTPAVHLIALGEGEEALVDIARNYYCDLSSIPGIVYREKNGKLIRTPSRSRLSRLEDIPRPAWHLLPLEEYLKRGYGQGINAGRNIPILATRGCPFQCTFCSNKNMWTQRYYTRSPQDVVDEIEEYVRTYKVDMVEFFDLTAIIQKEWIIEFGGLLKKRNLNIQWSLPSGTRSESIDEEVTRLMAETNCKYLVYAAESGSPRILKYIKKEVKLERMMSSMRAAKKNGISLRCNLMIGMPIEKRRDIFQTIRFQVKLAFLGVDDAPLYMFSPYPGTVLFKELQEKGIIPQMDEEYFRSLLCQMDLTHSSGYCYNIGPKELAFYRFLGMSLFYTLSYLFFPKRILRSYRNIFKTQRTETVFEQRIVEMFKTRHQIKTTASGKKTSKVGPKSKD